MARGDEFRLRLQEKVSCKVDRWFASVNRPSNPIAEDYFDVLASAPRKVDVLIRFDGTPGTLNADILGRLASHPKVGQLIIYGLPEAQRIQVAALGVMLGVQIRYCDSEEEALVLLRKRRSRTIACSLPGGQTGPTDNLL